MYPPTLLEPEHITRERIDAVEKGVAAAFAVAVRHLGEEEARTLFDSVARRKKRGRDTRLAPDRDARLLAEYERARQTGESIAALARRLHDADESPRLGVSARAIDAQIRKLVKGDEARKRAAEKAARLFQRAARHLPPTLLGRDEG